MTLIVRNLQKSADFLRTIFGAHEVDRSGDALFSLSRDKCIWVDNMWIALMEGEEIERSYNHIAFKIFDTQFETYTERLRCSGLERQSPRPGIEGEGQSIYFYDDDNDLFELHTGTLEERLNTTRKRSASAPQTQKVN